MIPFGGIKREGEEGENDITMNVIKQQEGGFPSIH